MNLQGLAKLGIAAGALLTLHHYLAYARWEDKNKEDCHGKLGQFLLAASLGTLILTDGRKNG